MKNWYKISEGSNSTDELIAQLDINKWVTVSSSFIEAVAYHKLAEVLEVKLKSGKIYTLLDVPEEIYKKLLLSPSKGTFFNQIIKRNFQLS